MQENDNEFQQENEIPTDPVSSQEEIQDQAAPPDESASLESEQNSEQPEPPPQEQDIERNPYKTLLNRNERERYRLKQENEDLRLKLDEIARLNDLSSKAASFHYEKTVEHRLRDAQDRYSRAVQESDAEAQIKANNDIVEAMSEKSRIDQQQAQENLYQEYYRPTPRAPQPADIAAQLSLYQARETVNWQRQNADWFDENSPNYDPELAQLVDSYAEMKAAESQARGEGYRVFSRDYFNDISNYVNTVRQERDGYQTPQRRQLVMKPGNQYVSPTTNRSSHSYQKPKERQLTRLEYNTAKELRIDPDLYRKQIIDLEKKGLYKKMGN